VVDSCLRQIVSGLRNRKTLRHVLRILRSWFSERAKLKAALRRVKSPTLLVWGDGDCTVPLSSAVKLHRKLRVSELVVLSGGGHAVFEETPEQANRIMLEWLKRHPLPAQQSRKMLKAVTFVGRNKATADLGRLSPGT
jgi:pimeloyl-ACP methyl ester carboxylesterase